MIGNEWDDILYWEDYESFAQFISDLNQKYDCRNPLDYERWCQERNAFYSRTIPTKQNFIERFERYTLLGKPYWVDGHHKIINELTNKDLLKSYCFASDENVAERIAIAEKARTGWAAKHLSYYAKKICSAADKQHLIMEMTVGAGVGTNAIVRSMTNEMHYIGVDIDFICAKNADVIGRFYHKNALGICTSLWCLPFANAMFDVVCSHFGLDECREIDTILNEASRVLKTGGRLILVSRHNAWLRRHAIFEKYDIDKELALNLMRQVRLYADFEQLDSLVTERGFIKINYIPLEKWYIVEYQKL